jgi:hypothetical protein
VGYIKQAERGALRKALLRTSSHSNGFVSYGFVLVQVHVQVSYYWARVMRVIAFCILKLYSKNIIF